MSKLVVLNCNEFSTLLGSAHTPSTMGLIKIDRQPVFANWLAALRFIA
ncbi:hypothetical protein [Mycolicibacterium baixiangningiae]|nr:hypothetical protein [Mycolicibacterium baixiangningiae]